MKKLCRAISENSKKRDAIIFLYVLASVFIRYICCGFKYFPQLDDYIQYGNFMSNPNKWGIITENGMLSSRPLAGIFDLYFWGHFFNNMIFAVLLISVLYAISAVLFLKIFNKHFKTGFMFTVFYAIMPFFFEGAYWVSASSRVVMGLFFTALGAYFLEKSIEKGKKYIPLFWIFQLISIGFYEQTLLLSFALCFVLIVLSMRDNKRNGLLILVPAVNAVLYIIVTRVFSAGGEMLTGRMSLTLPSLTNWYFEHYLKTAFTQFKNAFFSAPAAITFNGLFRGIKFVISDGLWAVLPIAFALGGISFLLCKNEPAYLGKRKDGLWAVLTGLFLTAVPVALFFVLSNPYISLRNILPSFVGIAIILDLIFSKAASRWKVLASVASAAIAVVFFVSSVSEIHDYKAIYDFDNLIAENVIEVMEDARAGEKRAFIIKSEDEYDTNCRYNEHGAGVVSSSWALAGITTYKKGTEMQGYAVPIETKGNICYNAWEKSEKELAQFDRIYLWDGGKGEFEPLEMKAKEDGIELYNRSGGFVAKIEEYDNIGYITYK